MSAQSAQIPQHVSRDVVRDIDIFNIQSVDPDIHQAWRTIQSESPALIYSPLYGGHWIPMRAHVIERVMSDHEVFINGGLWVPPNPEGMKPQIPIQADGALHRAYRSLIMPFLIGKPLRAAIEGARELAIELIESFRENGECDFAVDFAQHLPIEVFLRLVDLPSDDRLFLSSLAEVVRMPDPVQKLAAYAQME